MWPPESSLIGGTRTLIWSQSVGLPQSTPLRAHLRLGVCTAGCTGVTGRGAWLGLSGSVMWGLQGLEPLWEAWSDPQPIITYSQSGKRALGTQCSASMTWARPVTTLSSSTNGGCVRATPRGPDRCAGSPCVRSAEHRVWRRRCRRSARILSRCKLPLPTSRTGRAEPRDAMSRVFILCSDPVPICPVG